MGIGTDLELALEPPALGRPELVAGEFPEPFA